jgi:hypothetical protein
VYVNLSGNTGEKDGNTIPKIHRNSPGEKRKLRDGICRYKKLDENICTYNLFDA